MSDYADINREFQAYQDRIADLEARIEALEAALREISDKRKMDVVAAVSMQAIAREALAPEPEK